MITRTEHKHKTNK